MSTSYNNQWVLGRARARWTRRAAAADSDALGQRPAPPPREPHERQPSPAHQPSQPALNRPMRKHPGWIDRDT